MAQRHNWKGELLQYLDIGLTGTFIGLKDVPTEKGFVYIEYRPLSRGWFHFPKVKLFPTPIQEDHIHFVITKRGEIEGVESRIVMVRTGEEGSIVSDILDSDLLKMNEDYKEQIRQLKMSVASSRQESEDARSGVTKTIDSMKALTKKTQNTFDSGFSPIGRGFPPRFGNNDDENFGFDD